MAGKSFFLFLALASSVLSCSPYKALKKDFMRSKSSIDYIHTSTKTSKLSPTEIIFLPQPTISASIPEVSEVKRVANEVVPLIIFNQWNHQYRCLLGKKEIKEELTSFLSASLIEEGKRRGFQFDNQAADQPLQLEITIESVNAQGPYTNTGFFAYFVFFYFTQTVEKAGPAMAESRFHFKLKRDGVIVLDDSVTSSATFEPLQWEGMSFTQLHVAYRASLAELLGSTFEQNIDKVLWRVASTLSKM